MRRRFVARRTNRLLIYKIIGIIVLIYLTFILIFKPLFNLNIEINKENFIKEYLSVGSNNLLGNSFINNYLTYPINTPDALITMTFNHITLKPKENTETTSPLPVTKEVEVNEPTVYIYNTHQTEEYDPGNLKEYNITPTVYMASFMLEKALKKYNIISIVEEANMPKLLKEKGYNYEQSYYVSREWIQNIQKNNPTVKYFIDVHRDSVSSTVTIDGLDYAKLMFAVGKKHDNYQENEKLMNKITDEINSLYPNLAKKPYSGNRYNQDLSPNIMLIEVGGPKNTIDEVYNSINALAEGLARIIGEI